MGSATAPTDAVEATPGRSVPGLGDGSIRWPGVGLMTIWHLFVRARPTAIADFEVAED
jgi:hypothetical protein